MRTFLGFGLLVIILYTIMYSLAIQLKKDSIRISDYVNEKEIYLGREILIGMDSVTILEYDLNKRSYYLSNGKYVDQRIIEFKLKTK